MITKSNIGLRWTFSLGGNSYAINTENRSDDDGGAGVGRRGDQNRPLQSTILRFSVMFWAFWLPEASGPPSPC